MKCNVVIALVKLENLKAIHNNVKRAVILNTVVIALVKLENLKAIHNSRRFARNWVGVVIALVKLENLKEVEPQTARKKAKSVTNVAKM